MSPTVRVLPALEYNQMREGGRRGKPDSQRRISLPLTLRNATSLSEGSKPKGHERKIKDSVRKPRRNATSRAADSQWTSKKNQGSDGESPDWLGYDCLIGRCFPVKEHQVHGHPPKFVDIEGAKFSNFSRYCKVLHGNYPLASQWLSRMILGFRP